MSWHMKMMGWLYSMAQGSLGQHATPHVWCSCRHGCELLREHLRVIKSIMVLVKAGGRMRIPDGMLGLLVIATLEACDQNNLVRRDKRDNLFPDPGV